MEGMTENLYISVYKTSNYNAYTEDDGKAGKMMDVESWLKMGV
jgi:hypothetical protein